MAILADGIAVPEQIVSSGQITLDVEASVVQVGLPYDCDLETLKIEVQTGNGTAQGKKSRCPEVIIRLLDSRGGKAGPDSDHL